MWAVYALLALLALVLLILLTPVRGRITYDGELAVRVRVWGIPITLLPRPEPSTTSTPKKGRKKKDKPSKLQELADLLRQDDVGATLQFLSDLISLLKRSVGRLLRSVTVDRLELDMCIATGDPADTAQRYGQVCGVLYPSLAWIGRLIRIRRQQLRVEPNFLLETGGVRFDIRCRVSVLRLTGAALTLLWGLLLLREENT